MLAVATTGSDVAGGDELANAPAGGEEGDAGEERAGRIGEGSETDGGGDQAEGKTAVEEARHGEAAGGRSAELREEEETALLVGHVPAEAEQRKDGPEERCGETCEQKAGVQHRGGGTLREWR